MRKLLIISMISILILQAGPLKNACQKINMGYNQHEKKVMLEARAMFERLLESSEQKWLINYYIAYCDYRIFNYLMDKENKDEAKKIMEDGFDRLEACLDQKPTFGEAHALMSSYYGMKITFMPISGMWNGPKSGKHMEMAYKYNPKSPRVYLLDGIGKLHTPEKWGGGEEKAKKALQKAAELFAQQDKDTLPNWGHTDVYTWLGIIAKRNEDTVQAKEYFKKALEIEPNNGWVKYALLPELTQK